MTHDPFRCPNCHSTRTRSMRMIAMAGSRVGQGCSKRATLGAHGWWSLSGTHSHWTSQTELARRYSPPSIGSGGVIALLVIGALISGLIGALVALLLGLIVPVLLSRHRPDGFVCLRCGCEFQLGVDASGFASS